jgi:hypothetical protein
MEDFRLRKFAFLLSALALLGLLSACEKPAAVVNGTKISKAELAKASDREMNALKAAGHGQMDRKAVEKEVLDSLIMDKLIVEEAGKRNITVSPAELENGYANIVSSVTALKGKDAFENELKNANMSTQEFKDMLKVRILMQKLLLASVAPVTDQEVEAIYGKSPDKFTKIRDAGGERSITPDEAKQRIRKMLEIQRAQQAMPEFISGLKSKARIKMNL